MDSLGDRMKEYERVPQGSLIRRMPAILRLDGKAFHTLTRGFERPFDEGMFELMHSTMLALYEGVQTCVFAYMQSDEISLLLKDYTKLETQSWFGGNIQKICSISASIATVAFNQKRANIGEDKYLACGSGMFDARVFNIPKEDVVNYFVWRQKDATRNSINAVGQAHFSHKELHEKSQNDVLDMLHHKGINWNETPIKFKRGAARFDGGPSTFMGVPVKSSHSTRLDIPIFTEDRNYISRFLEPEV